MGYCMGCGRWLEERDNIGWQFFGIICGSCFLPFGEYVVENIEELVAIERAEQNAPGIFGTA